MTWTAKITYGHNHILHIPDVCRGYPRKRYNPAPSFWTDWPGKKVTPRPTLPAYTRIRPIRYRQTERIVDPEEHPSWRCRVLYKMDYPSPRPRLLANRRARCLPRRGVAGVRLRQERRSTMAR